MTLDPLYPQNHLFTFTLHHTLQTCLIKVSTCFFFFIEVHRGFIYICEAQEPYEIHESDLLCRAFKMMAKMSMNHFFFFYQMLLMVVRRTSRRWFGPNAQRINPRYHKSLIQACAMTLIPVKVVWIVFLMCVCGYDCLDCIEPLSQTTGFSPQLISAHEFPPTRPSCMSVLPSIGYIGSYSCTCSFHGTQ